MHDVVAACRERTSELEPGATIHRVCMYGCYFLFLSQFLTLEIFFFLFSSDGVLWWQEWS